MSATVAAPASLRERLADLTDALIQGVWPPDDCPACRILAGQCDPCAAMAADLDLLNGRMLPAIQSARTGAEALAHFTAGLMELAGADAGQMMAAVSAAFLMRAHRLSAAQAAGELAEACDEVTREMAAYAAGDGGERR